MQLDVEVSPPAKYSWTCSLQVETHMYIVQAKQAGLEHQANTNTCIEFWSGDFLSSLNFGKVTDRRTDRQTESDA